MASLWFTLAIVLYIISEVIAAPMRVDEKNDNTFSQLDTKRRARRQASSYVLLEKFEGGIPPGCRSGKPFVITRGIQCKVENAYYNATRKQCLVRIVIVPGMPDGPKGHNYICMDHYLFQFYPARPKNIVYPCPKSTTTTQQPDANKSQSTSSQNTASTATVKTSNAPTSVTNQISGKVVPTKRLTTISTVKTSKKRHTTRGTASSTSRPSTRKSITPSPTKTAQPTASINI